MKNRQVRKIIDTIILAVKDVCRFSFGCLIATILMCVGVEKGWFITDTTITITREAFWNIYFHISFLIPFIVFCYRFLKAWSDQGKSTSEKKEHIV